MRRKAPTKPQSDISRGDKSEPVSIGHELLQLLLKGDQRQTPRPLRYIAAWWGSAVVHLSAIVTGLANSMDILYALIVPSETSNLLAPFGIWFLVYVSVFALIPAYGISRGSVIRYFLSGAALPAFAYGIGAGVISSIGG